MPPSQPSIAKHKQAASLSHSLVSKPKQQSTKPPAGDVNSAALTESVTMELEQIPCAIYDTGEQGPVYGPLNYYSLLQLSCLGLLYREVVHAACLLVGAACFARRSVLFMNRG